MNNTIIIAEAGVNHNGSIKLAKKLIEKAVDAGADYIKFQTFKSELLVTKKAAKADYQKKNVKDSDNSQYNLLKKLELSEEQHIELINYCNKKGIKFLSSAFDNESIDFLASLKLGIWKIPSGEITNYNYLKKIASFGEPVILSTGMSTVAEIEEALALLIKNGIDKEKITILHCNTEYPTPMIDVNLNAMISLKKQFGIEVGYSDHTIGIEVPIAAVALGAKVIEKHFTLDNNLEGPDHKASLEPNQLKAMVSAVRNIELALGSFEKKISTSEVKNQFFARKSIVASKKIKLGEEFNEENLTTKRPGNGISPMKWEFVIGKIAKKTFEKDELIEL